MSRRQDRQTFEEARRGAAALQARQSAAPVAPPTPGASRNPAMDQFSLAAAGILRRYVEGTLSREGVERELRLAADFFDVTGQVDWDNYLHLSKEA